MRKHIISERRACYLVGIARSTKRYQILHSEADAYISERLAVHAARWKRFGYRRLQVLLEREGMHVNHKKIYRLYKKAGLSLRKQKRKKTYLHRGRPANPEQNTPNARWSMDIVSDRTHTGRRFRVFILLDGVTRECLALEVESSITGSAVGRFLDKVGMFRGYPKEILSDNGSEFTSNAMNNWTYDKKIMQVFIDPGKPIQNAYIESFYGRLRDKCLKHHLFKNLEEARDIIEAWRNDYNQFRPHSSLGYKTPAEYAATLV